MRHIIKNAALALLPLVLIVHARADEPRVITLSCEARTDAANKPAEPLQKIGVVVNLDERTVFFLGYVVPIESVDDASINFGVRRSSITVSASASRAALIGQVWP